MINTYNPGIFSSKKKAEPLNAKYSSQLLSSPYPKKKKFIFSLDKDAAMR